MILVQYLVDVQKDQKVIKCALFPLFLLVRNSSEPFLIFSTFPRVGDHIIVKTHFPGLVWKDLLLYYIKKKNVNMEFPGGLVVTDPALSWLWLVAHGSGLIPGPRNFHEPGCSQKQTNKQKKNKKPNQNKKMHS